MRLFGLLVAAMLAVLAAGVVSTGYRACPDIFGVPGEVPPAAVGCGDAVPLVLAGVLIIVAIGALVAALRWRWAQSTRAQRVR